MPDLRTRMVRAVGWTAVQRWAVRAIGFASFVLLSRLLTPTDIGLVALALAITGSFGVFVDFGMSDFLVRSEKLDRLTNTSVFWVQVAVASSLAMLLAAIAHPLSVLIGTPELAPVLQVLPILLPIHAAAAVPSALLHRRLSFAALALRDVTAATLGGLVGVYMALSGAGVWSLVGQSLVHATGSLVAALLTSKWHPGLSFSPQAAATALRFGSPLLGVQLLQLVRDRADHFIIGIVLGPEALGIWTVATRLLGVLVEVTLSIVDAVALPLFARIRSDPSTFQRVHRTCVSYSVTLVVPALMLLCLTAPVLIPILFGTRWEPAIHLVQVLCVAYAVSGLAYLNRPTLVAHGRVWVELMLTGGSALLHVGLVLAASRGGLLPVAWAAVVESVILVAIGAYVLPRAVGLRAPIPGAALWMLGGAMFGGLSGYAVQVLSPLDELANLIAATGLALLVFSLWTWATNMALLRELIGDVRRIVPRDSPML